jgi:hypothetical protein
MDMMATLDEIRVQATEALSSLLETIYIAIHDKLEAFRKAFER